MGLQTGSELARTQRMVIDPADLRILAFIVHGPLVAPPSTMLRLADIREMSDVGIIVDSADEFVAPDDIISISEIYHLNFTLHGMPVLDEKRHKLGKIIGFTIDTNDFTIQQLDVKRPLLKSFTDTELLIHRSQITEINDRAIIVHSTADVPEPTTESIRQSYINPFRNNNPAAERIERD